MKCSSLSRGLALIAALAACESASPAADDTPDGSFPGGKADGFGRFLIGLAGEYEIADPPLDEAELHADMKKRREAGWKTMSKVIEPVELFGLQDPQKCDDIDPFDGVRENCEPIDTEFCTKARLEAGASPDGEGRDKCTPIPEIPRWQTWYGEEDIKQMFRFLLEGIGKEGRQERRAFEPERIEQAFVHIATQTDRLRTWPMERLVNEINKLNDCPGLTEDQCAEQVQDNLRGRAGAGLSRIYFSPEAVRHILRNYKSITECKATLETLAIDAEPEDPENFSACFDAEFPPSAAVVKAHWARSLIGDGGNPIAMPVYDTSAAALAARLGEGGTKDWRSEEMTDFCRLGDNAPPELIEEASTANIRCINPDRDKIFTIRLSSGAQYRLVGLHVMTKETRHWHWATMWFSDDPDSDFGADRPAFFGSAPPEEDEPTDDPEDPYGPYDDPAPEDPAPDDPAVDDPGSAGSPALWANYKLCAVGAKPETPEQPSDLYNEGDPDAAGHGFPESLSAALAAVGSAADDATWCSNPYIEHGPGNASTNCIGCHQHGGAEVSPTLEEFDLEQVIANEELFPKHGRDQIRTVFPGDYTWSFNKQSNYAQVLGTELESFDAIDGNTPTPDPGPQPVTMTEVLELFEAGMVDSRDGEDLFGAERSDIVGNNGPCARCHGTEGTGGGIGPDLRLRVPDMTDNDLAFVLINGRTRMPRWDETLTAREMADIMAFLRSRFGEGPE